MENVEKILCDLIEIPSFGEIDQKHEIIKYLDQKFSSCKEVCKLVDDIGNTHFLVGVNTYLCNIENAFLLSGHIDTVVQTQNHVPIATTDNNFIYGLGSADMKGFVSSVISNMDNLILSKTPIIISLTSDEETDMCGIELIMEEIKTRNITPEVVIVGEPTSSKIALSNNGNAIYVCDIYGKANHTSAPHEGVNAINVAMKYISEIEKIEQKYLSLASLCITKINGGLANTIVPDLCEFTISVITPSLKILNNIENDLKSAFDSIKEKNKGSKITNLFGIPAFNNQLKNNSQLLKACNTTEIIHFRGSTEAGFIQQAFNNSDIIIYGPGNPECIHKSGEKIDKNELKTYSNKLPKVISNYYSLKKESDLHHEL